MNAEVTIREFGCLGLSDSTSELNFASIDQSTWLWLKTLCLSRIEGQKEFLRLVSRHGHECLQVRNYVGVLESPSGTQIEILPKTTEAETQSIDSSRFLLWKMLAAVNNISWIETEEAHLRTTNRPIIEVLIKKFLEEVNSVVKRGIRNDYVRVEEEKRFLRGRLNVSKQVRRSPSQQHKFSVEYDKYISDRPENRLLRSALQKALRWSKFSANQRLARELLFMFDAIPPSQNVQQDFSEWRSSRDMIYYKASKPWCQLILSEQSPYFSAGMWEGVSLLFPMEQLFEKYVAKKLSKEIDRGFRLVEQTRSKHLVDHLGQNWFELRPDIVIRQGEESVYVLDTKWKLIDSNLSNGKQKYKIDQGDMYQLFAYGQKYLNGIGEIFLVYPKHAKFEHPLEPFDYSSELRLWVVPYDLESDQLLIQDVCSMCEIFKSYQLRRVA